jgi:hypothetical protein
MVTPQQPTPLMTTRRALGLWVFVWWCVCWCDLWSKRRNLYQDWPPSHGEWVYWFIKQRKFYGCCGYYGLPFTIGSANSNYCAASVRLTTITFANQFQAYGAINTTTIPLEEITEAGTLTGISNDVTLQTIVRFSYHSPTSYKK